MPTQLRKGMLLHISQELLRSTQIVCLLELEIKISALKQKLFRMKAFHRFLRNMIIIVRHVIHRWNMMSELDYQHLGLSLNR